MGSKLRKYRNILIAGVIIFAAGMFIRHSVTPPGFSVDSSVRPGSIHVGDTFRYRFVVEMREGDELKLPEIKDMFHEHIRIRSEDTVSRLSSGMRTVEKIFDLTVFRPGEYVIPSFEVYYRKKGEYAWRNSGSRYHRISVVPVIKKDLEAERRLQVSTGAGPAGEGMQPAGIPGITGRGDGISGGVSAERFIKTPVRYFIHDITFPVRPLTFREKVKRVILFIGGGLAVLLLCLFAAGFIRYLREKPEPRAHEFSLRLLRKLERGLGDKDTRDAARELSVIVTEYLKKRFFLEAREYTAEDIAKRLEKVDGIDDQQRKALYRRLKMYEFMKYSREEPDRREIVLALSAEKEFINETAEKEEEEQ